MRGRESTWARNRPWSISTPSLSPWRMSGFGGDFLLASGPTRERAPPRRRRDRRGGGTSSRARSGDRRPARRGSGEKRFARRRARPTAARPQPPVRPRFAAALAAACQEAPPSGARRRCARERRPHTRRSWPGRPRTIPAPPARAGRRRASTRGRIPSPASCLGPLVDDALRLAERPFDLARLRARSLSR